MTLMHSTKLSSNTKIFLLISVPIMIFLTVVLASLPVLSHAGLWGEVSSNPQKFGQFFNIYGLIPAAIYGLAYFANSILSRGSQREGGFPMINWGIFGISAYLVAFLFYLWLTKSAEAINSISWIIPLGITSVCAIHFFMVHKAVLHMRVHKLKTA
ncbi:hypothetical protein ACN082_07980 [Rothia sp. CCM 9417]|uniref:hypothetical protein n=1 Tax=unclassified Rothia (in: high G+C Gram-positive bacteria) TaxID=2689056 RepID=UPI003AD4803A